MNYQEALEKLGSRVSRKLENHTYLERRENGNIAVRLHLTDVVMFHPCGKVTLDSGGWYSKTTKDRMNKYANAGIWQKNHKWLMIIDGIGVKYQDGLMLRPS